MIGTSLLAGAFAASFAHAQVPFLHDPVVYPPEVHPADPAVGGEIRVALAGDDATMGALVLEHTSVVAEVHAGLARVTLVQWFRNPYDSPIDATYLLPLPAMAAVDRMDLVCGDRLVEGVVMEREAARSAFDEARQDGRKAALLEQQRDNLFTQHLANLCPGEEVQVTLQYIEQLPREDGVTTLSLPTTVGERYSPPWVQDAAALVTPTAQTGRGLDLTVVVDEGMPVASLWSDTHDIVVKAEGRWGAEVGLHPQDDVPNRDFVLSWTLAGDQPRAGAVVHQPDPAADGYIALTLEPQVLDDLFEARPRELLFVIDSSCSMRGEPYEAARKAVLTALDRASSRDTFNLVRFSDDAGALFDLPQPVTRQTRTLAATWLADFQGGGTEMDKGIVHSLTVAGRAEALRMVLMITDGHVGGETPMFSTVRRHLGRARLFSLGVGASPNRYLLEGLAEMGRGDVVYHAPGTSVDAAVERFYDRIAHPAMSDITVDWGGLAVREVYPQRIPDLWAGQPVRVVARFSPDEAWAAASEGGTTVTVRGVVGTAPFRVDLPLALGPEATPSHEGVAALWARRRIRDLEWYPRGRSAEEVRTAIIDVALQHHLVSRYTSLVAIDEQPGTCGPAGRTVAIPHEAPATGASGAGSLGVLGGHGSGKGAGHSSGVMGRATARPVPGLAGSSPVVLGAVDPSLLKDVIHRHLNQLRYCYERALQQQPTLAGKVVVRAVVASDGSVREATTDRSTLGAPDVERCLAQRFLAMRFPAPAGGGEVVLRYPFVFSPGP